MMQLLSTNELNTVTPNSKIDSYQNGGSGNLLLEYESNSKPKGECYATIDRTLYTILTQGQKFNNQSFSHTQRNDSSPSMSNAHAD